MEKKSEKKDKAVCLVAVKNQKILLIKKENVWILPGGHPENSAETDLDCLKRHLDEQLPCVKIDELRLFGGFFGESAFKDIQSKSHYQLEAAAYQGEISGEIVSNGTNESHWFDNSGLDQANLSEITRKVVKALRKSNRL